MARAMVTEPKILLMDEPLSNLDARLREQMRVELRKITRAAGVTTLYVTHDQAEALTLGRQRFV
jgi:ABC-type sugar transport system ATPase subunit